MRQFLLLLVLLGSSRLADAGELSAFEIARPQEGAIGLVDGEIWFIPAPVTSKTADATFRTATHESKHLQIYTDGRGSYLAIDSEAKEFQVKTQTKITSDWKWSKVGGRGDTRFCHLEVAEGTFKGRFLGIDEKPLEIIRKKTRQPMTVKKLKLVEKPDGALMFHVYPLSK